MPSSSATRRAGPYVKKVAKHAYEVTDKDMTALRQAGYSDDQIFEATVSAALGVVLYASSRD